MSFRFLSDRFFHISFISPPLVCQVTGGTMAKEADAVALGTATDLHTERAFAAMEKPNERNERTETRLYKFSP